MKLKDFFRNKKSKTSKKFYTASEIREMVLTEKKIPKTGLDRIYESNLVKNRYQIKSSDTCKCIEFK